MTSRHNTRRFLLLNKVGFLIVLFALVQCKPKRERATLESTISFGQVGKTEVADFLVALAEKDYKTLQYSFENDKKMDRIFEVLEVELTKQLGRSLGLFEDDIAIVLKGFNLLRKTLKSKDTETNTIKEKVQQIHLRITQSRFLIKIAKKNLKIGQFVDLSKIPKKVSGVLNKLFPQYFFEFDARKRLLVLSDLIRNPPALNKGTPPKNSCHSNFALRTDYY